MILENPFHRLGLLADVDTKGFTKRIGRVKALLAAEMPLEFKPDLHFIGCMRNSKTMEAAERDLQTAEGKVQHGMLWFTSSGIVDEVAIEHLRCGQFDQALAVWQKACARPEISANYISCLNNLGSLQILLSIVNPLKNISLRERQLHFLNGLENKVLLLTKPSAPVQRVFFQSIGDDIVGRQTDKIRDLLKESIPQLIDAANTHGLRVDVADWASKISSHGEFAAELLAPFQNDIRHQIEQLISEAEKEIEKGGMNAYNAGKRLKLETSELLENYGKVAAKGDVFVDGLADKVAETMLNAGIKYFNGHEDLGLQEVTRVLSLTESANDIARGQQLKNRLKENLETLRKRQKNEKEVGQIKKENRAMNAALDKALAASPRGSSRNVVLELTPGATNRWGVMDALIALEKKGVSSQGASFRRSATFKDATDAAANVLLSRVIAEVNDIQENMEMDRLLGKFDLNKVTETFKLGERACRLLLAKFNTRASTSGGVQVFEVERKTRNRLLENHETIKGLVQSAESARRRSEPAGCAVVFWIVGGASLLTALASCM